MRSKLRVETEIAERGSTAEQPLSRCVRLLNNAPLDVRVCISLAHACMDENVPTLLYISSYPHTCVHFFFFFSCPQSHKNTHAHKETTTPSHISNPQLFQLLNIHTLFCVCTPNTYTPLPSLAGTIKLHPAFSALSRFPCSHSGAELQPPFKSHSGRQYK